jgi:hypothetical protein
MKALLLADEANDYLYRDIVDSTVGIIFLGTPIRGSTLANWGSLGTDVANFLKSSNKAIVKLLKPDSDILFQLRDSFLKLVRKREDLPETKIILHCYFEELGMGPGVLIEGKVRSLIERLLP